MTVVEYTDNPGSATQWYELGLLYRKSGRFGDAVNAFRMAADSAAREFEAGLLSESESRSICDKVNASVELIQRITGFVNKDLMNP